MSANYLCLGPFDLISSGFCIFSSLGPINLIMIILTHILVQVLCVSLIAKTLYWNMAWEAIFAIISPFLVIDDNTTKASKMNCKNMKLIPIWKVRNYLACLDDISMLILKALDTNCRNNCRTMTCVRFEPYEQWKFLYLSPWDYQIALLPHID